MPVFNVLVTVCSAGGCKWSHRGMASPPSPKFQSPVIVSVTRLGSLLVTSAVLSTNWMIIVCASALQFTSTTVHFNSQLPQWFLNWHDPHSPLLSLSILVSSERPLLLLFWDWVLCSLAELELLGCQASPPPSPSPPKYLHMPFYQKWL